MKEDERRRNEGSGKVMELIFRKEKTGAAIHLFFRTFILNFVFPRQN